MRFRFNPMIEIGLGARAKIPGEAMIGEQRELFLCNEFPDEMSPYERLLGDAIRGEGLLFAREDGVEEAWRVVDKVLTHHHVAHCRTTRDVGTDGGRPPDPPRTAVGTTRS